MCLQAQKHLESKFSIQKDQVPVLCADVSCLSENDVLLLKHEGEFMNMDGCSEMIWTYLIYSNFIILGLYSKQLLAQHILYLGLYIAAISLGAYQWLQGAILSGCCDITPGQAPGVLLEMEITHHRVKSRQFSEGVSLGE